MTPPMKFRYEALQRSPCYKVACRLFLTVLCWCVCVCASTFSSRTATRESPKQNWRASPSGFLLRSSLVRLLFLGLASGLCKDSRRAFRHRLCKGFTIWCAAINFSTMPLNALKLGRNIIEHKEGPTCHKRTLHFPRRVVKRRR